MEPLRPDFVADLERQLAARAAKPVLFKPPDGSRVELFFTADQWEWIDTVMRSRVNRANRSWERRLEAVLQQLEDVIDRRPS
jgi:hypothetical protein